MRGTAAGSWCKQVPVRGVLHLPPWLRNAALPLRSCLVSQEARISLLLCEVSIPAGFAVVAPKLVLCQAAEPHLAEMQLPGGAFLGRCVPALVML